MTKINWEKIRDSVERERNRMIWSIPDCMTRLYRRHGIFLKNWPSRLPSRARSSDMTRIPTNRFPLMRFAIRLSTFLLQAPAPCICTCGMIMATT
jgi:hypothetical protein